MSSSFRIEESELRQWHTVLSPRMGTRGVAAITKEIEAHMAKKDADGTVVVSRHQLFTWAEALQGAATRDGSGALPAVVSDMRAILGGKNDAAPQQRAPESASAAFARAPAASTYAPPAASTYAPPAPVTYGAPAATYSAPAPVTYGGNSGARLVEGAELRDTVNELIRSARGDLFIISPWDTGMETLVAQIAALPPGVRILIVSRRPAQETPAYHQAMDQLGRRKAITAFSNLIQTRMIVQDTDRAIVGAASVPGPMSREAGLVLSDRASVAAVRAHFERIHAEATGGR